MVFVRQCVHLTTYFFIATDVKHILAELLIADEPVMDTQEISLLTFLLERIPDEVLVIPWLLLDAATRNREEIHGVLNKFLVFLRSISQEVPAPEEWALGSAIGAGRPGPLKWETSSWALLVLLPVARTWS